MSALPTLASNRLIGFAGSAIIGLFFSIFLFEYFDYNITITLLWFFIAFAIRIPSGVIAAKIFSKTGLVPSMVIGTIGYIIYFASLYVLDVYVDFQPFVFLTIAIIGLTILNGFYWAPFHVDFATFQKKGRRGREIALICSGQRIIGVLAPIFGGLMIVEYGYGALFLFAIFAMMMSLIPLVHLPRTYVQYEFGFFETYKKLVSREFRSLALPMFSYGAEGVVGMIIWPIFLYLVFDGEYLSIGLFAGLIVVISILLQLFIGNLIDKKPVKKILSWGTHIYAIGWFAKSLVDSVLGVFAASTFHTFGSIMMMTPMDAIYYERAADSGHYVDEFTVIRETAINIGRLLMTIILIGVTAVFDLQVAFIVAAVVSLGISILNNFQTK